MKQAERIVWAVLVAVLAVGPVQAITHPSVTLAPGESITITAEVPSPSASSTPTASATASAPPSVPVPTTPPPATPTPSPAATPTPVPSVAPTPSASPTTQPTPTLPPSDPFSTPFGTRPQSSPISLSGSACQNITISNKTIRDVAYPTKAIRLENCNGVVIEQVDFINVSEGVYAVNSSNITLRDSRYQNITGPAHDAAGKRTTNAANLIQLNNVSTALVDHNKGKCGDTEDIVSVYASRDVVVEDNWFEGALTDSPGCLAWKSNSGSAIALGDGNGTNETARRNIVVNPGQVGIFIVAGSNNHIDDNIIIGQQRPNANVGAYIYGAAGCADTFLRNRINWSNASGAANPYYDRGGDGCSPDETGSTPEGGRDTTLDPNAYRVQL